MERREKRMSPWAVFSVAFAAVVLGLPGVTGMLFLQVLFL